MFPLVSSVAVSAVTVLLAFVSKFRTSSSVIDEPVADLSHADTGRLKGIVSALYFPLMKASLTFEKIAFCSSLGYGFVMFCSFNQYDALTNNGRVEHT